MSKPKKHIIYALCDPRTTEIRYIGKSVNGLKRAKVHLRPSTYNNNNTHCYTWIKSLVNLGTMPIIEEIEICENNDLLIEAEIFYIAYFRSLGFNLTNHTDGGEGISGHKMTDESKEKWLAKNAGRPRTEAEKAHLDQLHINNIGNKYTLGFKHSEEFKEKTRKRMTGIVKSEETKAKIGKAHKGKQVSEETRKKLSISRTGKSLSLETKKKMSLSTKGIPKGNQRAYGWPIIDENGNIYKNCGDAAKSLGCSVSTVNAVLNGVRSKTSKGHSFRYVEEEVK